VVGDPYRVDGALVGNPHDPVQRGVLGAGRELRDAQADAHGGLLGSPAARTAVARTIDIERLGVNTLDIERS
jgi:hypothetical protein